MICVCENPIEPISGNCLVVGDIDSSLSCIGNFDINPVVLIVSNRVVRLSLTLKVAVPPASEVKPRVGVKVRVGVETVPSVVSELLSAKVTSAVGWLLRTTPKVAVPPASLVVKPVVGVMVMPTKSL
ncbi:MAG TPA: hypothetical protein V6D48_14040 [Oculatellaceae cyanobacterium]